MNDILTFHCDFGGDVSVTLTFDVALYRETRDQNIAQKMEWTGKPTRKIIPRYIEWNHTVNAEIAKTVNAKILYVVQRGPKQTDWEKWVYYPDGKRERAGKE